MKKYRVIGQVNVNVYVDVTANSADEATEKAYNELNTLEFYAGGGSCNKLIGVCSSHKAGIESVDDIEYTDAEEIKE